MQPLPETFDALRELARLGDGNTAGALLEMGRLVEEIVPDLLGLSLTLTHEHLTFTMTTGEAAAGDEDRSQPPAQSTATAVVASTLSLPILHNGVVTADVDLYASSDNAFDDHHEALAQACGAQAEGAVADADLNFRTRLEAVKTPGRIRAQHLIDQAVGALMSRLGVDLDQAEDRLRQAAERAGLSEARMARAILALFHASCGPAPDVAG